MTRRKDGLWQQQMTVMENGRKKQKCFYGKTKAEVLRKIANYKENLEAGELFGKVACEWWEQHEPTLAYNSTKPYKPAIQRAIDYFGDTPISQIRPSHINLFLHKFIAENHPADKTVRTQLMVSNLIFRYAVQAGYLESNPARDLTAPKNLPKSTRPAASDEDIRRVKISTDCTFGMFAYWLMYTGCRRGELLALTWEDVDINARTITINKSMYHVNNRPQIKRPKTKNSVRVLPLLDKLVEKITPSKSLIFHVDGSPITETQFQRLWKLYCKESGVTATPHQLRHTYTVMLIESNIDPQDAQILLGHAQISTTMDIYNEIREQRKKRTREDLLHVDIM